MMKAKEMPTFNLNYSVYVRLNDKGYKLLSDYFKRLKARDCTVSDLKRLTDKDGYLAVQGWVLMQALGGDYMQTGSAGFGMNIKLHPEGLIVV